MAETRWAPLPDGSLASCLRWKGRGTGTVAEVCVCAHWHAPPPGLLSWFADGRGKAEVHVRLRISSLGWLEDGRRGEGVSERAVVLGELRKG